MADRSIVKTPIGHTAWVPKIWNGLRSFYGNYIWSDGTNIYYSYYNDQYVLDKSTSTWIPKTWNGLIIFDGQYIWTGGTNIYYSYNGNNYILTE